jgi:hypothetical protein
VQVTVKANIAPPGGFGGVKRAPIFEGEGGVAGARAVAPIYRIPEVEKFYKRRCSMGRARCDEELADRLGVAVDLVAAARAEDDVIREGRQLVFTPEGEARVAEQLGVDLPPQKKEAAPAEVVLAVVVKCCRNPTWVYARVPGEAEPVPVRVRNNSSLQRGKRVRVVRRDEGWLGVRSSLQRGA